MERLTDPLTTTDAKLWADEFMKVKARLGEQKFDHAMMLGWFANAIMVGYDEGSRRAKADVQATVEALQREVNTLNQLLRDKGLGQGEIDGMAADVDLQQALDAEREKVKGLEEIIVQMGEQAAVLAKDNIAIKSALSQLQTLVRAYCEAKVAFDEGRLREDHHAWKERFSKLERTEAALIDYTMRTLDATTPAVETPVELNERLKQTERDQKPKGTY